MKVGNALFSTESFVLVPVCFTEGDCRYSKSDTELYYGFQSLPSRIPYSRNIENKKYLIIRLKEISLHNPNPSYVQLPGWIITNL